ncbi:MAG: hypothetical protein PUE38_05325, partial [Olsenella sp.]|nr:hypothetical protein [Olsenella sp.]
DFAADGPWEKMGTDVTEFKQPWGKAYFAPVYDFGSKEIVAWSTSLHPVSVNLFFTSFAKQAHRSRKGGFTGCANVFSPIPVTA